MSMSARRPTPSRSRGRLSTPQMPTSARQDAVGTPMTPSGPLPVKKLSFSCTTATAAASVASVASVASAAHGGGGGADGGAGAAASEPVQVHLRIRPFTASEAEYKACEPTMRVVDDVSVELCPPERTRSGDLGGVFTFSKVHDPSSSNTSMYDAVMKPMVATALKNGRNGLLFAYGMTNAGKTHTVLGSDADAGLLPRAAEEVLRAVTTANRRHGAGGNDASDVADEDANPADPATSTLDHGEETGVPLPTLKPGEHLSVTVSSLEIYNEQVLDGLVVPECPEAPRPVLKLKNGINGRVYAQGLKQIAVSSVAECLDVVRRASQNRQVAETVLNSDSSRSHSVFCLHIWKHMPAPRPERLAPGQRPPLKAPTVTRLWSKLSVVDLAGSERQRRTANRGARLKEAGAINNSLMSLMHCMETMRWNQKHPTAAQRVVPFRETKLTRLFQDNLAGGGTGVTVMVLNVGPSPADYDETVHAVKYGALAKEVQVVPPRVSSRWALPRAGGVRRRNTRTGAGAGVGAGCGLAAVMEDGSGPPVWEAQRKELMSQIQDLQAHNDSLQAELRLANERAAAVEMEVRQEVADEMAEQLAAMERRYRSMQVEETKAAESRVEKLVALYNRRTTGRTDKTVSRIDGGYQGADVTPRRPTAGAGATSAAAAVAANDDELGDAVAECEQEIDRICARHRAELELLKGAHASALAAFEKRLSVAETSTVMLQAQLEEAEEAEEAEAVVDTNEVAADDDMENVAPEAAAALVDVPSLPDSPVAAKAAVKDAEQDRPVPVRRGRRSHRKATAEVEAQPEPEAGAKAEAGAGAEAAVLGDATQSHTNRRYSRAVVSKRASTKKTRPSRRRSSKKSSGVVERRLTRSMASGV